jgi:hypothetical protein
MTASSIFIYRGAGLRKTLNIKRRDTEEVIDCTDCSAEAQLRTTPGRGGTVILSLSTDTPPAGLASGMTWVDEANGQLQVVIGEDDSTNEGLFPRISSTGWQKQFYLDVIVRDPDGIPKFAPIKLDPIFTETATISDE